MQKHFRSKEQEKGEDERPHEEVGPEECAADAIQCGFEPGDRDGEPHESQFSPSDEIDEMFEPEPIGIFIDPEDGLPRPADPDYHAFAPPFTYGNVVCVEDDRLYYELFVEELFDRGWKFKGDGGDTALLLAMRELGSHFDCPNDYERWMARRSLRDRLEVLFSPPGMDAKEIRLVMHMRYGENGEEAERLKFRPDRVKRLWGQTLVEITGKNMYFAVRPRREACKYYKRQMFNVDGQDPEKKDGRHQFQNCTMRRSLGGAFMSLNGQAIFGCDYRDPIDPITVARHLDRFDKDRLNGKRHLHLVPAFGMSGEERWLPDKEEDEIKPEYAEADEVGQAVDRLASLEQVDAVFYEDDVGGSADPSSEETCADWLAVRKIGAVVLLSCLAAFSYQAVLREWNLGYGVAFVALCVSVYGLWLLVFKFRVAKGSKTP